MKMPPFLAVRSPRERALVIALGVLALMGIAFILTRGGGDETTTTTPPADVTPTASPTPSPLSSLPIAPVVFEGKDPFEPLVSESPAPGAGGGTAPTPGPTGGPTGGGSNPSGQSRRVTLVDIFTQSGERMATVDVDGTQYTVHVGDTFATNYRLLALTSNCGTFVFGDERFTLCIGQQVRK